MLCGLFDFSLKSSCICISLLVSLPSTHVKKSIVFFSPLPFPLPSLTFPFLSSPSLLLPFLSSPSLFLPFHSFFFSPLLFSYPSLVSSRLLFNRRVVAQLDDSEWSAPFSLDSVGVNQACHLSYLQFILYLFLSNPVLSILVQ